jgi:bifunctional DNase/RNase
MTTSGRIGAIAWLGFALVGAAGAGSAREQSQTPAQRLLGPQEVEVVAVAADPRTETPVVVLEGKRDKRRLLMTIGPAEATGIVVPLKGLTPPRPLTHDLFLTLFGRLKVSVSRVVITDLRDDVYYATLHLTTAGGEMTLDSRPSDAIALAVRARVPVLVEDRVFDKSGSPGGPGRRNI